MKQFTPQEVLDLPMPEGHESGAATIRQFFVAVADRVWNYGEEFSGKHPFGNANWHWDLYRVLVQAGVVEGFRDGLGGELLPSDIFVADRIVRDAIRALGDPR